MPSTTKGARQPLCREGCEGARAVIALQKGVDLLVDLLVEHVQNDGPAVAAIQNLLPEAIHAPPRRNSHPRHESLALDASVREKHKTSGGKEISLALEPRLNIDASIPHRFEKRPVDFALTYASW